MSARRRLLLGAGLGVAAIAALIVSASLLLGEGDGRVVQAEFEEVRGLIERNDVLVNGAKAGTVENLELTERGTALVTIRLDEDIPAPRADAAASVRPVDLLGDIYLSLSLGESKRPLEGPIPTSRTTNVPRLADLLRAFQPGARAGLQAMLVEMSLGLESRGVDLNRAAAELRPAIEATDEVMRELSSQNASLRSLIEDSQRVTDQLADRDADFDGMIRSFKETMQAIAGHAPELDRGLARLSPTFAQLRGTTTRLAATASELRPLADQLHQAAPGLTTAMGQLSPFLDEARIAANETRPTLRSATDFLSAGERTFDELNTGLRAMRGAAPQFASLMDTLVPLMPLVSKGLFVETADQVSEPGDQPFDPNTEPLRHYWRGAAVMSCESFGVKIEPGCLEGYLRSAVSGGTTDRAEQSADRERGARRARQVLEALRDGDRDVRASDGRARANSAEQEQGLHGARQLLDFLLGP